MAEFYRGITLIVSFNIFVVPKEMSALRLLRVDVPKVAIEGQVATLRCEYDLEEDKLYSVLWYKDHEEFYRYVPRNDPKQLSYELEGFRVLTHKSDDHVVLLQNINLKATGVYRCEVSAEAPSFTSVHGEGLMEVIDPPDEDPEITGDGKFHQIGDVLSLNCTSGKSYPSARLKWFVNDLQMESDYEAVFQHHGLLTSIVGLNFKILPRHFVEGRMVVRCVSTIYNNKNSIVENKLALLIDKREAFFQVEGSGNSSDVSKWIIVVALTILFS